MKKIILFLSSIMISCIMFAQETDKANISIPEESFSVIESTDKEDNVMLSVVNSSLRRFKEDTTFKRVFGFYCSILFEYKDVDEFQWPSKKEFSTMQKYTENIIKGIKGDSEHPNALFVARVTYKGTCEIICMLNNPDPAIEYLDGIISKGKAKRAFEYRIEGDPEWESIGWFLQDFS